MDQALKNKQNSENLHTLSRVENTLMQYFTPALCCTAEQCL